MQKNARPYMRSRSRVMVEGPYSAAGYDCLTRNSPTCPCEHSSRAVRNCADADTVGASRPLELTEYLGMHQYSRWVELCTENAKYPALSPRVMVWTACGSYCCSRQSV